MFDSTWAELNDSANEKRQTELTVDHLSPKEKLARANGVPEWRLQYNVYFDSVVRGHHIYKTLWKPEIGEKLICKKDDRNKAALYEVNAIGIYKEWNRSEGRSYSCWTFAY